MKVNVYEISPSVQMGVFISVFNFGKVSEDDFFKELASMVKELTSSDPDMFDETLLKAKEFLSSPNTLTILTKTFKHSTKKIKDK